jgi:hypothetical protein
MVDESRKIIMKIYFINSGGWKFLNAGNIGNFSHLCDKDALWKVWTYPSSSKQRYSNHRELFNEVYKLTLCTGGWS